ncbi:MAG: nucleoside-triphosphatase [Anaerolineae bacterium]
MFILLTGPVHEGKTTACWRAIPGLRAAGFKVVGFVSPPLLDAEGRKVGIELRDLTTGQRQTFARVGAPGETATVGVYQMSAETIEWARRALAAALRADADWIVIDEIGPLELHDGGGFAFALEPLADPLRVPNAIVIVRETLAKELAERLGRADIVHVQVTEENRSRIPTQLVRLAQSAQP